MIVHEAKKAAGCWLQQASIFYQLTIFLWFMDFDLDDVVNRFYDDGFKDGYDHGRIHGLIEGRALGKQKGCEIWEELGFYEGFALCWRSNDFD